jgi:hypothetical protein
MDESISGGGFGNEPEIKIYQYDVRCLASFFMKSKDKKIPIIG